MQKEIFPVVNFTPDDLEGIITLFKTIRATETDYPPKHKIKDDKKIKNWILAGEDADRFLIREPEEDKVVAYVSAQKIGKDYEYPTSDKVGNTYNYWQRSFGGQQIIKYIIKTT